MKIEPGKLYRTRGGELVLVTVRQDITGGTELFWGEFRHSDFVIGSWHGYADGKDLMGFSLQDIVSEVPLDEWPEKIRKAVGK